MKITKIRMNIYGRIERWEQPHWIWENQTKGFGPVFDSETEAINYVAGYKSQRN